MNVEIASRPAERSAIAGTMAVMTRAFPPEFGEAWTEQQLRSTLVMPGVTLYVAKADNEISGFALVRHVLDEAELLLIAIDPAHRRKSAATNLLSFVERHLYETGITHMFLEMRDGNPAEFLYRRFGFEKIGHRPNYYRGSHGGHYDAVTFGKNPLTLHPSNNVD